MKIRSFLIFSAGLLAISFNSHAANAPITTIASVTACPGSVVNVPITVTNFTGIAAITLTIDYDPAFLTFNSCTSSTLSPAPSATATPIPNSNLYHITISWFKYPGSTTLVNGSTILTMNFSYINGSTALTFNDIDGQGTCEYGDVSLYPPMNDLPTANYYYNGSVGSKAITATGTITGSQEVIRGTTGLIYSTTTIANATSYTWTVPTGFTITAGSGTTSITVTATSSAVSGAVTVKGTNTCGNGPVSSLNVEIVKPLSVTALLESLYNGTNLNKAKNATGDQFTGSTADQVSIELHNSTNYNTIVYTKNNVNLSTAGVANANIPITYSSSYYITVKHRNSIETVSASPVSFSGTSISYSFDTQAKAYGNNLKLLATGVYGIFAGDVNLDGIVEASDLILVDNAAANFLTGYLTTDVNGDGHVNGLDQTMAKNNAAAFVSTKKP